jgi:hypothetical protein
VVSVVLWEDLQSVQFTVAQWTRYLHLVWFSGQTGRTGFKGSFVGRIPTCTVHCSTVDEVRLCGMD